MSTFFNDVLSATKNLLHATVNVPFDALHATNAVINAVIGNKVSLVAGQKVRTVYGNGFIERVRDSDVVVKLFDWKLAQGQSPTLYLAPDAVRPLFSVGDQVKTIYGRGFIKEVRAKEGDYVVLLHNWKLAQGQSPTCYLDQAGIKPLFSVFERVKTVYGSGFVQGIREKDYIVKLDVWKLADGRSPTLYLAGDSIMDA